MRGQAVGVRRHLTLEAGARETGGPDGAFFSST
jgi:hypothetical protein